MEKKSTFKKISLKLSGMIAGKGVKPVYLSPVLPKDKRDRERFIVEEFAKTHKVGGFTLTDIEASEDDSHGRSDVRAKLNGVDIGLQLTELKIEHRPRSADIARKITVKLIDCVLKDIKPPSPILVDIQSPKDYENVSLKLRNREIQMLAGIIIEGFQHNEFSPSVVEYFDHKMKGLKPKYLEIPDSMQGMISKVEIQRIPEGYKTTYPGKNNVHINFHFDQVVTSDIMIQELIGNIYRRKELGSAEILLVWCCDEYFWVQEEVIKQIFQREFARSSFKYIYLFFFMDAEGPFQVNKKIYVIKEK